MLSLPPQAIRLGSGPLLRPMPELEFDCPFLGRVKWAEKDVFNPSAVVHEGKVHLFIRAEDKVGRFAGVSRIGLAISDNGLDFEVLPEPILFPGPDGFEGQEWEGGCEDPRVVESPEGGFVMTYSAYNGTHCLLHIATSNDLRTWTKHGHAFGEALADEWSKSGAILCELREGRLVAKKLDGKYWMHYGEGVIYSAVSEDLIHWEPVDIRLRKGQICDHSVQPATYTSVSYDPVHKVVVGPRTGRFDSRLTEPGPSGIWTEEGIMLLYNGSCPGEGAHAGVYSVGAAILDPKDPSAVIARTTEPILSPETEWETLGQTGRVTFAEGLVYFKGRWILYYGTADSLIAAAELPHLMG